MPIEALTARERILYNVAHHKAGQISMREPVETIKQILDAFGALVTKAGGEMLTSKIAPPVTEPAVTEAESQLGYTFPPRFRRFLTNESAGIEFSWTLDDDKMIQLEGEREPIGGGDFKWSFDELVSENATFQGQDIEGDELLSKMVGRDKIILATVANGDMFAVGLSRKIKDRILYLSHDLEKVHNYIVASDIADLYRRCAPLGFAGPEYWVWEQFTNGRTTMIDPSSAKAREFLARLGKGA